MAGGNYGGSSIPTTAIGGDTLYNGRNTAYKLSVEDKIAIENKLSEESLIDNLYKGIDKKGLKFAPPVEPEVNQASGNQFISYTSKFTSQEIFDFFQNMVRN